VLYPTELRGRAVVATAGGFCQTDTSLARRARVLVQFDSDSRSTELISDVFEPEMKSR
jgi:hypothetical protein